MQWNENGITLGFTLEKGKEYRVCLAYRRTRVIRVIDKMGPITSDELADEQEMNLGFGFRMLEVFM